MFNPSTGRICEHIDTWDSISNQKFFSLEVGVTALKGILPPQHAALSKMYNIDFIHIPRQGIDDRDTRTNQDAQHCISHQGFGDSDMRTDQGAQHCHPLRCSHTWGLVTGT